MTPLQQLKYKKLQKKYAGSEWKYMAIDRSGSVCVYTGKPFMSISLWNNMRPDQPRVPYEEVYRYDTDIEDWKDTLVEL